MPFHQRVIVPRRLPERNENDGPYETFSDLTNQTLANVIRQLASLTQFAEEIIGESSNALVNQQSRLQSLSDRIEILDQRVHVLNPKHVARLLSQTSSPQSQKSSFYQSVSNVDRRLFIQQNRPQSVVRLQSGLDINPYLSPYQVPKQLNTTITNNSSSTSSSRRPSRPRSLESDVLLLVPENGERTTRERTTSLQYNSADSEKVLKRSTTVGACQGVSSPAAQGAQRKLLAEFNRNDSEGSTSPERDHRGQNDIHGFADSRLALVRRSMIARRTQARLREKRRRNRTVALSPEDDRRSSFISTFLADTKQLQDQSCQVPSENSTLSNKNENGEIKEEMKNALPREFDLIAKQMELQDTSSGCWSGGSTIQGRSGGFDASTPTPKLLLQELNDRHNKISAPSSQASSRDDDPLVKSKPDPPRRSLSSRPSTLEYEIDPAELEQNGEIFEAKNFDCFAPIVLTPSNPSEGDFEEKNAFIFPSPPKKPANSISSQGSESLINSPARSSSARSESSNQMNEELSAKLARRLTKIELIESGQSKAFDKEDLNSSLGSSDIVDLVEKKVEDEQFTVKPINFDNSIGPTQNDAVVFKLPAVSSSKLTNKLIESEEMPSVEVIWDNDLDLTQSINNPIPEPITPIKTPTSMMLNSDSESQCSEPKSAIESPLSSPCRYQVRPMVIQPSLQATQSLMERGRTSERRTQSQVQTQRRLGKTNSANFKSLLLRSIGSNDKTMRSSAAERLKVAPGKTLQDLYRPKSSDSSPQRRNEAPVTDSSPRKVRNKSKNRYNTLHRLTSIVEEKDILAAKELMNSKEDEVFD